MRVSEMMPSSLKGGVAHEYDGSFNACISYFCGTVLHR